MATEMKMWRVSDQKKLELIPDGNFPADHLEKDLETWIENSPDILGEDLLVIARQLKIPGVGILDLLCIDSEGAPVIVELKRDSTPREAIAQSLDYASWLDTQGANDLKALAESNLKKSLVDAFSEVFQDGLPEIDCQRHRIILVAPKLDAAAERIINYLAERYSVGINAVFFKYAQVGGEEILARSVLVSEEASRRRRLPRAPKTTTPEDLDKAAQQRNVTELVNICRRMNTVWDERPSDRFAGCWRYSATTDNGWRSLLLIDVSGAFSETPTGELDVRIRWKNVAEVTATDEAAVRNILDAGYSASAEKFGNLRVRLRTKEQAEKLVQQLMEWVSSPKPQNLAATA